MQDFSKHLGASNVYIFWGNYRTNGYKYEYIHFFPQKPLQNTTHWTLKMKTALHFQQNLNICIYTVTKSVLHMALDTD